MYNLGWQIYFLFKKPPFLQSWHLNIKKALSENNDSDVAVKEDKTREKQTEEDLFLGEIMKSKVMTKTQSFH